MTWMGVPEVAHRLGVSPQRVRQQITEGRLIASRVGGRWLVDEAAVQRFADPKTSGRPLSYRSVWALISVAALAEAEEHPATESPDPRWAEWLGRLSPTEQTRARTRWASLRDDVDRSDEQGVATSLRQTFGPRAQRLLLRAAEPDLPDLRTDARVTSSGVSQRRSGLASGSVVEGYVDETSVDHLVREYFLRGAENSPGQNANVVLHVLGSPLPARPPVTAAIVLAADLAEHRAPREEARAAALLHATPRGGRP